jgi:hypothetical protein
MKKVVIDLNKIQGDLYERYNARMKRVPDPENLDVFSLPADNLFLFAMSEMANAMAAKKNYEPPGRIEVAIALRCLVAFAERKFLDSDISTHHSRFIGLLFQYAKSTPNTPNTQVVMVEGASLKCPVYDEKEQEGGKVIGVLKQKIDSLAGQWNDFSSAVMRFIRFHPNENESTNQDQTLLSLYNTDGKLSRRLLLRYNCIWESWTAKASDLPWTKYMPHAMAVRCIRGKKNSGSPVWPQSTAVAMAMLVWLTNVPTLTSDSNYIRVGLGIGSLCFATFGVIATPVATLTDICYAAFSLYGPFVVAILNGDEGECIMSVSDWSEDRFVHAPADSFVVETIMKDAYRDASLKETMTFLTANKTIASLGTPGGVRPVIGDLATAQADALFNRNMYEMEQKANSQLKAENAQLKAEAVRLQTDLNQAGVQIKTLAGKFGGVTQQSYIDLQSRNRTLFQAVKAAKVIKDENKQLKNDLAQANTQIQVLQTNLANLNLNLNLNLNPNLNPNPGQPIQVHPLYPLQSSLETKHDLGSCGIVFNGKSFKVHDAGRYNRYKNNVPAVLRTLVRLDPSSRRAALAFVRRTELVNSPGLVQDLL